MTCMCGDICCWSCGPAQGDSRCGICGEWASECCEHIDETTGRYKPEYEREAELAAIDEAEADELRNFRNRNPYMKFRLTKYVRQP